MSKHNPFSANLIKLFLSVFTRVRLVDNSGGDFIYVEKQAYKIDLVALARSGKYNAFSRHVIDVTHDSSQTEVKVHVAHHKYEYLHRSDDDNTIRVILEKDYEQLLANKYHRFSYCYIPVTFLNQPAS